MPLASWDASPSLGGGFTLFHSINGQANRAAIPRMTMGVLSLWLAWEPDLQMREEILTSRLGGGNREQPSQLCQ